MASPYDASEPTDEIIEAGFDPLIFWDRHKQNILVAIAILLVGGLGFAWYQISASQRTAAAQTALSAAATEDDYQKIVDQYPGTVAAGNASLLLADKLRGDKKYDEAAQLLNTFLAKYPTHPLAHAGMLSLAETLEAQGKADEAMSEYSQVAAKYPDSYSAPLAALAQASLLKSQGKLEEARRMYENFLSQFPDSVFTNEAMAEMHLLRTPHTDASASGSPAAAPAAPSLLQIPGASLPQSAAPSATSGTAH